MRYSFCIETQNVSMGIVGCFILSLWSLEIVANSYSWTFMKRSCFHSILKMIIWHCTWELLEYLMCYLTDKMSHIDRSCNSDYVVLKIVLLNFLILIMNSNFIYIFTKWQYFMSNNGKCDLDTVLTHHLLRHVLTPSSKIRRWWMT